MSPHGFSPGFMLQGGDPLGTGKGGECIWGGHIEDEFHPDLRHGEFMQFQNSYIMFLSNIFAPWHGHFLLSDRRGVVSMANNGPNTNGCQFFLIYSAQPHLNNMYTIFGQVNYRFILMMHYIAFLLNTEENELAFRSNSCSATCCHAGSLTIQI